LLAKALTKTDQLLFTERCIILFSNKQDTNRSSARLAKQCMLPAQLRTAATEYSSHHHP